FNPAIVTNTTVNTNLSLSTLSLSSDEIQVYPNPASDVLSISGKKATQVEIYDMTGKLVKNIAPETTNTINIQSLSEGIYQVVVHTKAGIFNSKLVIDK